MKLIKLVILIYISTLITSGCSSIAIRVHALDMDKMRRTPEYLYTQRSLQLQSYNIMLTTDYFDRLKDNIVKQVNDSLQALNKKNKIDINSILPLIGSARKQINIAIDALKEATTSLRNALDASINNKNNKVASYYDTAYFNYLQKENETNVFLGNLSKDINSSQKIELHLENFIDNFNISQGLTTTFGTSIVEDKMASFVVKAPEDYWRKYRANFYKDSTDLTKIKVNAKMNVTRVTTFIGNSDIAIKMDAPGTYTIKGVRLDADAAFRASFKVLGQGIKYLTYSSGVPSASGSSGTPTTKIPEIQNLAQNKAKDEYLNRNSQSATNAFLNLILIQADSLFSKDINTRASSIKALKEAYITYKSQLQTQ